MNSFICATKQQRILFAVRFHVICVSSITMLNLLLDPVNLFSVDFAHNNTRYIVEARYQLARICLFFTSLSFV